MNDNIYEAITAIRSLNSELFYDLYSTVYDYIETASICVNITYHLVGGAWVVNKDKTEDGQTFLQYVASCAQKAGYTFDEYLERNNVFGRYLDKTVYNDNEHNEKHVYYDYDCGDSDALYFHLFDKMGRVGYDSGYICCPGAVRMREIFTTDIWYSRSKSDPELLINSAKHDLKYAAWCATDNARIDGLITKEERSTLLAAVEEKDAFVSERFEYWKELAAEC